MPAFLITLVAALTSWIGRAVAVKVALATLAVSATLAITLGFTLAMQALISGVSPSLHPDVVKGLSLMPAATTTYINICASATVLRWLYDRQWQYIKIWLTR